MNEITFNTDFDIEYGVLETVAPGLRRIVANNPGPFTFKGTGTYVVGNGDVAVIDPGPMMPDHINQLLRQLGNERVSHILVTHTHTDHSPASRLLQAACDAPIFAYGPHADLSAGTMEGGVDRDFAPDFLLKDGETIGTDDWQLQAIHTPGHCSNHLCFAWPEHDMLFCGDQLMAWSTTVILPPDGSIRAYLNSLQKLKQHPENIYWPTHGAAITQPHDYIDKITQHRLSRVEQVFDAINTGRDRIFKIREHLYPHISASLHGGAELSVLASIEYLIEQNRIKVNNHSNTPEDLCYQVT